MTHIFTDVADQQLLGRLEEAIVGINIGSSGTTGFIQVRKAVVQGPTTDIVFDTLNGNDVGEYVLISRLINTTAILLPNNLNNTNFKLVSGNSSIYGQNIGIQIGLGSAISTSFVFLKTKASGPLPTGTYRCCDLWVISASNNTVRTWLGAGVWHNSTDNITSLVVHSVSGNIGIGSTSALYKIKP